SRGILGWRDDPGGSWGWRDDPGGSWGWRDDPGGSWGWRDDPGGSWGWRDDPGGSWGWRDDPGGSWGWRDDPGGSWGWRDDPGGSWGWRDDPGGSWGWRDDPEGSQGWRDDPEGSWGWRDDPGGSWGWRDDPEGSQGWRGDPEGSLCPFSILPVHQPLQADLNPPKTLPGVGAGLDSKIQLCSHPWKGTDPLRGTNPFPNPLEGQKSLSKSLRGAQILFQTPWKGTDPFPIPLEGHKSFSKVPGWPRSLWSRQGRFPSPGRTGLQCWSHSLQHPQKGIVSFPLKESPNPKGIPQSQRNPPIPRRPGEPLNVQSTLKLVALFS
uniref:Uncharacterized protein n=1 Tax=Ficedula albicollis TaxID=59894 RepID=A0A803WEQ4_FICAL